MIAEMHKDFDALNILRPDMEPRATHHIAHRSPFFFPARGANASNSRPGKASLRTISTTIKAAAEADISYFPLSLRLFSLLRFPAV